MTERQKKIYGIALAVAVLMCVVPPWHLPLTNGVTIDEGYSLIFSPPANGTASIDFGRLTIQLLVVGAVGWGVAKLRS
jgi:hypothetical protein